MKHEGFATAFERLDREVLALQKGLALGSAFAWNWQARLDHPSRLRAAWNWTRERVELLLCAVAALLALCA